MDYVLFLLLTIMSLTSPPNDSIGKLEKDVTYWSYLPLVTGITPQKGAAWAYYRNPADVDTLGIEWYYTYSTKKSPNINAEFVPFLWSDRWPPHDYSSEKNLLDSWIRDGLGDHSGFALIFNECDLHGSNVGGQCDRTPRQAAYIYKKALDICPLCRWVGPVTSDVDYSNGWAWQKEFYGYIYAMQLRMPEVGAIHTYITDEDPQLIVDSYFNMLSQFPGSPKTAWVTEFGAKTSFSVNWMLETWENDPRITRWAYFAPRIPYTEPPLLYAFTLINKDNKITPPGWAYSNH